MSVFSNDIIEKDKGNALFLKTDMLLEGIWQIKKIEIIVCANVKYGANDKDALFKREVLKAGETLRYTFLSDDGEEKTYDSKGMAFYIAFKQANPDANTKIKISREGSGDSTRYAIEKIGEQDSIEDAEVEMDEKNEEVSDDEAPTPDNE